MEWFGAPDYWLSRLLFERSLGAIYLIAFLVARNQFRPLLGERGLLPAARFLAVVRFRDAPSLFHIRYSDRLLGAVTWVGMALAASIIVGLPQAGPLWAPMVVWLALWVLYVSIVNVGQTFYAFGWESLLCEAGALAILVGSSDTVPPILVVFMVRWLLFRVEFGAGLIKLRGDRCWRDLTCLQYHHETQPMPNPLSRLFHLLPARLHQAEVLANHGAQLVVPFLLFTPQPVASIAGALIVVTQAWLICSGNFSWLNVITMTLAIFAFSDSTLALVLPVDTPQLSPAPGWYDAFVIAVAALVALLSYWPVRNLVSQGQRMNYSFNRLHFVGSYGAFGHVTKERYEVIVEGTDESRLTPATAWREYEFKGKPGDPRRRPPQIAPYHLRLDWLMWFAGLGTPAQHRWFERFVMRLLENDRATLKLIRHNPFPECPPTYVRARLFRYRFTTRAEKRDTGARWVRAPVSDYLRPRSSQGSSPASAETPTV